MGAAAPDPASAATAPLDPWLAPLLLPEELGASDRWAIDGHGIPGIELMERAGAALASAALAALPAGPIAVLCGPGNNGGDGLIAARLLSERGREVRVLLTKEPGAFQGDAALARDRCGLPLRTFASEALEGVTGAIDALLGTGSRGAARGVVLDVIRALAERRLPVVACDLPSGTDAATGAVDGEAIQAIRTVTFHRPSPGHLVHPAKEHVGALQVADIGIPGGAPIAPQAGALRELVLRALPTRDGSSHKYAAGAVVVIAGGATYPGAGLLAVRGAQRGGAGYVTAYTSEVAAPLIRAASPEAIVTVWPADAGGIGLEVADLLGRRADAVVVGPGLGDDGRGPSLVDAVLASDRPVVLDADGLAPFAASPEALRRDAPLILTPHAGELGRLLGRSSGQIGEARVASAREAAARTGAVVVLKGDDTVIARPDGRIAVNDLPSPALATAGTGDVLAGATGALLAAGVDPWLAACAAVRLHARAGRLAAAWLGGVDGVAAWDVAERLPAARSAAAPRG